MKTRFVFSAVGRASDTRVSKVTARDIRIMCGSIQPLIAGIRAGDTDLKRSLPAVCWAAEFTDSIRHLESAHFTGLCFLDIDHIGEKQDVIDYYTHKLEGREEDLGIIHAQISPSGKGLHLVFVPQNGRNIADMQERFAKMAGIEQYDTACKDLGRMMFLSSTGDTLYDALDTLSKEETTEQVQEYYDEKNS